MLALDRGSCILGFQSSQFMPLSPTVSRWMFDRISPEPNSGCWLWVFAQDQLGYGRATVGGRSQGAHRVVYELEKGPIPSGLELDHLCRTRICVNPDHLEPVTHAENVRRGSAATATHCKAGHEYTASDVRRVGGRVNRHCRECARRRNRDFARAQRASAQSTLFCVRPALG